ncbi:threonine synthase [Pseudodesulfovibrio mercurii]|uniref:Threonine synthase n=1 Tax=Pseudodesulfovibrio mercurii TaxID=641491 RepID=F0JDM7_9BACT|nr:threonine synthase [Pseudodesulfovibrio mercurii]EGB14559.1 threonine synthase [Pseudodesulfovibrio mercurii]
MNKTPRPDHVTGMRCTICGKTYLPGEVDYVCPDHGNEGILDIQYDYDAIGRQISPQTLARDKTCSQWRYRPLLPVLPETPAPAAAVGWTPLYESPRLASALRLDTLFVKDDSRQPTGSLKDRASALAVMKAREAGADMITTASTGNAAAALAGMCAASDMPCTIFVPRSAPRAKVAQLLAYGARVFLVDGSYDDAFELCLKAAAEYGWYNRNTGFNPYMAEGKKTAAFEICEQLDWRCPDAVFVGVGDGCIISGLHKGFLDMYRLGWIDRLPRLMGVQAEGSDFLYRCWKAGADPVTFPAIRAHTVADSISAGLPRDRKKAMESVTDTGGAFLRVSDEAILQAIPELARATGVFAEPAGASPLAGLHAAVDQGLVRSDAVCVLLVTGSGLKDVDATIRACAAEPRVIAPTLDALDKAMNTATRNQES